MSDFFDYHGQTEIEELARIHEAGPEGLRERDISPKFFRELIKHELIQRHGPEHYAVSRRGMISLERAHMLGG